MNIDAIVSLSDDQLCGALKEFARDERDATARLVAALGEMDRRRLFLAQGCPSLFAYCTQVLHLAEAAAYSRIEVARLANRWPLILDRLAAGSINLTAARLLATHLTDDNHRVLLDAAAYKSKRDVQEQMAARRPQPDVPSSIRKLPNQIAPAVPIAEVAERINDNDRPYDDFRGTDPRHEEPKGDARRVRCPGVDADACAHLP